MTLTINPNDDRVVMRGGLRHAMFTHRGDASNYVQRASGEPLKEPDVALDEVAAERDSARAQLEHAQNRAGELGAALDVAQKRIAELTAQVAAAEQERAAAAKVRAAAASKSKAGKAEAPKSTGQTAVGEIPTAPAPGVKS